jgi:hypothetical protein
MYITAPDDRNTQPAPPSDHNATAGPGSCSIARKSGDCVLIGTMNFCTIPAAKTRLIASRYPFVEVQAMSRQGWNSGEPSRVE